MSEPPAGRVRVVVSTPRTMRPHNLISLPLSRNEKDLPIAARPDVAHGTKALPSRVASRFYPHQARKARA